MTKYFAWVWTSSKGWRGSFRIDKVEHLYTKKGTAYIKILKAITTNTKEFPYSEPGHGVISIEEVPPSRLFKTVDEAKHHVIREVFWP
jgi:hypothetical protein